MEQHPIKINKVQIRNLQIEDYAQLSQSFTRVYSDGSDVFWTHKQIQKLINIFPEGQIVSIFMIIRNTAAEHNGFQVQCFA